VVAFAVFVLLGALPAAANPFLGGEKSSTPAPVAVSGGGGPFVALQLAFRDRAGAALNSFKENPNSGALAALLLGAFVYGFFHAAGPGHRKTVMFSLFLSREAKAWEPLAAGFLSAGVHAATGIAVIGFFSFASGAVASLSHVDGANIYMEGFTFLALALAALILAFRTIRSLATGRGHVHGAHGHGHGEDAGHETKVEGRRLYAIAAMTSVVPCPGATMILLFALYLNLAFLGILAVLAMSLGMAIVVAAAGYLAYFGREGLFHRLKAHEKAVGVISHLLELGSYLFMLLFALYAAWPFLVSLIRT
jgi:ABC-type nickel/cobalt efflux system permease component RcnA